MTISRLLYLKLQRPENCKHGGMSTALSPLPTLARSTADYSSPPFSDLAVLSLDLAQVRIELRRHLEEPAVPTLWRQLIVARRTAAQAIARLPRQARDSSAVADARQLVREISASGILDTPLGAGDSLLVAELASQGWPGLLAAMTLTPAWQWAEAPALQAVPDWLWGDYTAWLFTAPQGFTAAGQSERFAAHYLHRAQELLTWVKRNRGSAAVRTAVGTFVAASSSIPLYFSTTNLRPHAMVRGQLLTAAHATAAQQELPPLPYSRTGRRLRVGFVNRHFGAQTETYTTLPTFEHLDRDRFEVTLYALHANPGPLEDHCRARVADFQVLPAELTEQIAVLQAAALDIVVFGTNVTAVVNEVARLALHRFAPLQVVNNSSCITSGLPEVDLYVSGALTEAPGAELHFSERLGLLPGAAHAFNYQADAAAPTVTPTRAELGLPADAVVFATAANYFKIVPEMQQTWARLLAAVPGSYLLVHPFNPNWSSQYPIARFCSECDRALAAQGVDPARLIVSTNRFPSRTDVKELLRVGDIYLDTFPFGGVNSLVDPLEIGLPVVVWEGDTFRSRMGAALLRELQVTGLTATTGDQYVAIAARLAADPEARQTAADNLTAAMKATPLFLDPLAASDAFGSLLETAYDELCATGAEAFRKTSTPLRTPGPANIAAAIADGQRALSIGLTDAAAAGARRILGVAPAHPEARTLLGRALLEKNETAAAVEYLLGAVQHRPEDASLWFDLSRALRLRGQLPQAIEALQVAIERDPQRLDAWLMLVEVADRMGAKDLVRDAFDIARQLGPEDPRVVSLASTLAA